MASICARSTGIAFALCIAVASPAGALAADGTRDASVSRSVTKVAYASFPRIVTRVNGRLVIRQASLLGSAPHICSPSGFGKRSSCEYRSYRQPAAPASDYTFTFSSD